MEDDEEWVSVLDGVWKEDDWENHRETLFQPSTESAIVETEEPRSYIASFQPLDSGIHSVDVVVRPELLETGVWDLKDGEEEVGAWAKVIEDNTTLPSEVIAVRQDGDDVRIRLDVPHRYSVGIVAVLL